MRLGFIGTGAITKAIVTGLCTAESDVSEIWLSPRTAETAQFLAASFSTVRVASSNQEVLDRAATVILAVRPQVAREILGALRFRPDHHVISLIATFPHELIEPLVTPARTVVRAAPLPSVARHLGPTILWPRDGVARALFGATGKAIEVESVAEFDALFAVAAEMASFFALLDSCANWLIDRGVRPAAARSYLSAMYFGLADTARTSDEDFATLIKEHSTGGGINEQLHYEVCEAGVYERHRQALDAVLARIQAA